MYGYLHTNAQLTQKKLNIVAEDASRSHRKYQHHPQVTCNLYTYNERTVYCRTPL